MRPQPRSGPTVQYQGEVVILGQTRFAVHDAGFRDEDIAEVWPNIAFPRAPLGIRQADAEPVLGDANTSILFPLGRPYRRISIAGRGSWTEWIEVRPDVIEDIVLEYEPGAKPGMASPFRAGGAPVPNGAYLAHQRLRSRLERSGAGDALALEESALAIACEVLAAGFAAHGTKRRTHRASAEGAQREAVFHVQALLNHRLAEPLRLSEISDAVGISPYHLCRIFRKRTGVPIHRYRDWLRVRSSLEKIAQRGSKILDIGMGLGYANEAHFSDAFRRAFGMRPSEFRRSVTGDAIRRASRRDARPTEIDPS